MVGQGRQLVEVGGEEGAATEARRVVQVLDDGAGDGQPVPGRRAASDLVEQDEAPGGGVVEDVGGSSISTMKVDWPEEMSSCAPMRVKMRSTRPMRAAVAGTNEPIWAMSTMSAVWRSQLLLPAMFGPVRMVMRWSPSSSSASFGTKSPAGSSVSSVGCLPPRDVDGQRVVDDRADIAARGGHLGECR